MTVCDRIRLFCPHVYLCARNYIVYIYSASLSGVVPCAGCKDSVHAILYKDAVDVVRSLRVDSAVVIRAASL